MYYDLEARFILDVKASYDNYVASKNNKQSGYAIDLKKGIEAASSLYHFGEHVSVYLKRKFGQDFRNELVNECSDYSLLGMVANVNKHCEVDRGNPLIASTDQVYEVIYLIEYEDDKGIYQYAEKGIELKLNNSKERNLLEVLTNVINMWYKVLNKYKIINYIEEYKYTRSVIHPRVYEDGVARDVDLGLMPGLGFTQVMILEKYNYIANELQPIDMFSSYEFSIKKDDEEVKGNVLLCVEEREELESLATEIEREDYFMNITCKKNIPTSFFEQVDQKWGEGHGRDIYLEVGKGGNKILRKIILTPNEGFKLMLMKDLHRQEEFMQNIFIERGIYDTTIAEAKKHIAK